ncbi:hypothetical protein RchiOBHm_Chr3g0482001 [Rosa chinensis]|uniref:Uncharacterized protein n=2 Tax=Rosa chinensis TaxID=74649 RepID=A0A2P6RE34_ROSCH|nr:hypothetical protein RchiOBHm_Chr3g0482001 [Rosa chinensis]
MEDMNFAGNGSLASYIKIKAKAAADTSPFPLLQSPQAKDSPSEMDIAMTYKGMETEGLNTDKYDGLH